MFEFLGLFGITVISILVQILNSKLPFLLENAVGIIRILAGEGSCEAEVTKSYATIAINEEVSRFEIPMDEIR